MTETLDIERLLPHAVPPPRPAPDARRLAREQLRRAGSKLVVLDDDPTGTQTVHDVPVYLDWSASSLAEALREEADVVYISTNSRGLEREEAVELGLLLGRRLRAAEDETGARAVLASRSDSTLRGHFPAEVDALVEGYRRPVDGVILCPAFFEGGRYTADDVHYVLQASTLVPAAETEFARDPVFGYSHSNLREWVAEKVGGLRADDVQSVSLDLLRAAGSEAVQELLLRVIAGRVVVVNALCYDDLDQFVLSLVRAEEQGKRFVYRCAAGLVKARGGIDDRPLLTRQELTPAPGPGLVVIGSWVERTTSQLACLLDEQQVVAVELDAGACAAGEEGVEKRAADAATAALRAGKTAAIYTSRQPVSPKAESFAAVGRRIMAALCETAARVAFEPSFVIAKGGITSIEIARRALGARRAQVLGQIAPGVPVWRLGAEARWAHLPYIVFPGNVGTVETLREVMRTLS
ncbi:MAG: four-carbon acid sugar kinase family protein [Armatimonadota bacterium]